jgi:hypothetical protein
MSFPLISLVAKSHQPLWKWLERAAPAVGAALIIAGVNPATAQQGEAPQKAEIAIPMNDQQVANFLQPLSWVFLRSPDGFRAIPVRHARAGNDYRRAGRHAPRRT